MKHKIKNLATYVVVLLLTSCEVILFSKTQPVNVKNETSFDQSLHGTWIVDGDTFIVSNNCYINKGYDEKEIILTNLDSNNAYVIRGDTVFQKTKNNVSYGKITLQNEEVISYLQYNISETCLGSTVVLRKLGENYILNTHPNENQQLWWTPLLITKLENNDIIVRSLSEKDLVYFAKEEILFKNNNNYYMISEWDDVTLNRHISNGMFSDTIMLLQEKNRVR